MHKVIEYKINTRGIVDIPPTVTRRIKYKVIYASPVGYTVAYVHAVHIKRGGVRLDEVLTPTTEGIAREVASQWDPGPISPWEFPQLVKAKSNFHDGESDEN